MTKEKVKGIQDPKAERALELRILEGSDLDIKGPWDVDVEIDIEVFRPSASLQHSLSMLQGSRLVPLLPFLSRSAALCLFGLLAPEGFFAASTSMNQGPSKAGPIYQKQGSPPTRNKLEAAGLPCPDMGETFNPQF